MAKPSYPRARRLAETIRRLAGEWLEAEQVDQPVPLVTVTDVRVTEDLHHASVYFTVLGDDQERAAAEAWLASSTLWMEPDDATQTPSTISPSPLSLSPPLFPPPSSTERARRRRSLPPRPTPLPRLPDAPLAPPHRPEAPLRRTRR